MTPMAEIPHNWQSFAKKLFRTEEADPGYMMLARADLPTSQKMRFMVAWCTYYNPGIAAHASERKSSASFWSYLYSMYPVAQRASERRHFRGAVGMKAIQAWEQRFKDPERMVEWIFGPTYFDVRSNAKSVPQIGTYFVWKFADVQERVFRLPCDFTGASQYSPKVPQEGAKLIDYSTTAAYDKIIRYFGRNGMLAPPHYDRPMNMQEAETVCCIFHQYVGGSYWQGSRTAKAITRLLNSPCRTSEHMARVLAAGPGAPRVDANSTIEEMKAWASKTLEKNR